MLILVTFDHELVQLIILYLFINYVHVHEYMALTYPEEKYKNIKNGLQTFHIKTGVLFHRKLSIFTHSK